MGGAAPGSLISIRGFRLGPAAPDAVRVRIRRGETRAETAAVSVNGNEIEAIVPDDAPLGSGMFQVVRNEHASLEWPIEIVESSFGAFSRNRQGWGPGEISNADGAPNSETQPAKPAEMATITGTGLGSRTPGRAPPQVLVAGRPATGVNVVHKAADRPGVDTIAFRLPTDAPEGCHVPVHVSSAPGIYSNGVTMAVTRDGSPCLDRSDWAAGFGKQKLIRATVGLVHADLEMGVMPKDTSVYPMDAGFASFSEIERGARVNPLFLFPPVGTCNTLGGTESLKTLTPFALLEPLPGQPLYAGPGVTIRGSGGQQVLPESASAAGRYWSLIGGRPPVPGSKGLPLFLKPGEYQISAPGGRRVGAFHTTLRADAPLIWRNRHGLGDVERARGATVTWLSPEAPNSKIIAIVAMNEDSQSGAIGVSLCHAEASSGSFQIPPYALANIPPTPAHSRTFTKNLILLLELPEVPVTTSTGTGVDGVLAFAASVSARTVQFK
jgi:uncharacterized protein (TIGR03437 family)